MANLCAALASPDPDTLHKIAVAAALHDMGIWTDATFDYLQPSVRLAREHLAHAGRADWTPEIAEKMIAQHHKLTPLARPTPTGWSSRSAAPTGPTSPAAWSRRGAPRGLNARALRRLPRTPAFTARLLAPRAGAAAQPTR